MSSFSADSDTSLRASVNTLPQATLAADVPVQVPVVNVHRSRENGQITHFKIGKKNISCFYLIVLFVSVFVCMCVCLYTQIYSSSDFSL